MATNTHKAESAHLNPIKQAFGTHRLCDTTPLGHTGIDAAHEILPMIYSLATLLEMGHRKDLKNEAALDNVNPELIAAAFDGIAYLAALADFHLDGL